MCMRHFSFEKHCLVSNVIPISLKRNIYFLQLNRGVSKEGNKKCLHKNIILHSYSLKVKRAIDIQQKVSCYQQIHVKYKSNKTVVIK